MPILRITIEIEPPKTVPEEHQGRRIVEYTRDTKRWNSSDGTGLYPGEIKLVAAIDEIKAKGFV